MMLVCLKTCTDLGKQCNVVQSVLVRKKSINFYHIFFAYTYLSDIRYW